MSSEATLTEAQRTMAEAMSERELQDAIIRLARATGWRVYHTYDSRRSEPGFPDLVMLRNGRMVVAELKTEKGKLTKAQKRWYEAFDELAYLSEQPFGNPVLVHIWRPQHWHDGTIEAVLAVGEGGE